MHSWRFRFITLFAVVVGGCADVYAQGIARQVVRDFDKIESYHGRVAERGVLEGDETLVTDVIYQKPLRARADVLAPASRAGEMFLYDGKRMVMWFPQLHFGIEVTGLDHPSDKETLQHVRRLTAEAMRAYAFSLRSENRRVAGERAKEWKIIPAKRHPYRMRHTIWSHDKYTIPLKIHMKDGNNEEWYAMEFEEIRFNEPVDPSAFDFEFPENAVVFRWDLSGPGISQDEAFRTMNFAMRLPTRLPRGHSIQKFFKSPHCLPALVITMNNGASWLTLTETRYVEGLMKPRGKPVNIAGLTGYFQFLGTFSTVTWVKGDTHMTLTGNISYPALLDVAASVE